MNNNEEADKLVALTEQVKHLAECIEKILPYGIPGPSRVSGSQEQPIILSSDEDIKVKIEKSTEEETEKSTKKSSVSKKTPVGKRTKKKAPVKSSSSSSSSSSTEDTEKSVKKSDSKKAPVSKRAKEKAPVRTSSSSSSSSSTEDTEKCVKKSVIKKAPVSKRAKEKAPVKNSSSSSSSSSLSSSRSNDESSPKLFSSLKPFYLNKNEMPKKLKDSLRKEVIRKYDALPDSKRANLGVTFSKQKKLINNIISEIKGTINASIFPITDEVIYDIIHSLHRHRREEYLKRNRSSSEIKIQRKRKHSNSRRHDKRIKRKKTIKHLQFVNNPLIKQFDPKELKLVCDDNHFHSPEDSETDTESGKSIIAVKDLKWRSSTLRQLLRDYVDRSRGASNRRTRERIFKENDYCKDENSAPLLASRWARAGYKGRLKDAVLNSQPDNEYDADIGENNDEEEENEKGEEKNEVLEEVVEEIVLMTSSDQHNKENSDDEYLEMDDGFDNKS